MRPVGRVEFLLVLSLARAGLADAPSPKGAGEAPLNCPSGTERTGARPPQGLAEGCVRKQDGQQVRHGPWRIWHANGSLSAQGEYTDGVATGPWSGWWPDGSRQVEGFVAEGHPRGVWKIWAEPGRAEVKIAEDANLAHFEAWYRGGQKLARGDCAQGRARPGWLGWESNGQMTSTPALAAAVDGFCAALSRFSQMLLAAGEPNAQDSR